MIWFIIAIIVFLLGLASIPVAVATHKNDGPAGAPAGLAATGIVLGLVFGGIGSVYSQSVGQASVIVNLGGTVAGQNVHPGFAIKAPWQSLSRWDLLQQSVTFAGGDRAPSYTGGEVAGQQVTASVKGGAQTNFDFSAVYSLGGESVETLYSQYRTQKQFTEQVIIPKILAIAREVPSAYTPVEFRGDKRGEAQTKMLERLNETLAPHGITVSMVNLQNVTFTEEVEASIKGVEVAQQKEAEAEANLRATEVSSQAQVIEAQAQAEANQVLSQSLTPELLQQRWIDAIRESGSTIVVPEGSTPFIQVHPQTPTE